MAVSFVASTNTTYASRTNTTITAPTGLANGDLIVLGILTGLNATAPTATPPAGWTAISGTPTSSTAGGFNVLTWLYYRVAASEGASWTWTHATASSQGFALAYRGVDNTTPMDVAPTVGTGTGPTLTWTGLTTVTANTMLVAIDHDWGDVAPVASDPAGYAQRFNPAIIYAADKIQATAGATGAPTRTCASSTGDPWSAFLLALRPASSGATLSGIVTAIAGASGVVALSAVGGSTAATAAASGTLSRSSVSGSTSAVATTAGTLPLSTITGTSSAVAATSGTLPLSTLTGIVTATATTVGTVARSLLAGVTAAVATTIGTLTAATTGLAGIISALSGTSGTVNLSQVAGTTAASATLSGTVDRSSIAGTTAATSTTTGTLLLSQIAGVIGAVATTAGTLARSVLAGVVNAVAAVIGTLSGAVAPASPTPLERTFIIPAEDRRALIVAEDRTLTIPSEDRTVRII